MTRTAQFIAPFFAVFAVIGTLFFAAPAKADVTVCGYLDAHPNVAGVEDVFGMAMAINGMTPQQAAEFVYNEVATNCPRHFLTLSLFRQKWAKTTAV